MKLRNPAAVNVKPASAHLGLQLDLPGEHYRQCGGGLTIPTTAATSAVSTPLPLPLLEAMPALLPLLHSN
jgi:hypothetical protein